MTESRTLRQSTQIDTRATLAAATVDPSSVPILPPRIPEKEEFEVLSVSDRRVKHGRTEYHVRWRGYSAADDTWEPVENLVGAKDILARFDMALKEQTAESKATSAVQRRRVSEYPCERCRRWKKKCSFHQPCERCQRHGQKCVYGDTTRKAAQEKKAEKKLEKKPEKTPELVHFVACDHCRKQKIKCSGHNPCRLCQSKGKKVSLLPSAR